MKINPLKLTLVTIALAIVLTILIRYLVGVVFGYTMHPAFSLVIYIILFAVLKVAAEIMVNMGKLSWLRSDNK